MNEETKFDLKKRRIRGFFLTLETNSKDSNELSTIQQEISENGMTYVQMRLLVSQITSEFEEKLTEKIEKKIVKASIRIGTEKDLESVKKLYNRSWLTSNTPFRPISLDSMKKIFDDPLTVFLLAKVYGIDGGFVIIDFEGEKKEHGIIAGLGVLPRFQRKGLGTVLGMAVWKYMKKNEKQVEEIRCEVYKDNKISYSFIKGIGFEIFDKKTYVKEDFHINDE